MTNPYHARVQQKLVHCRLTLQLLDRITGIERQTSEAILQAAALHLAIGWRLYLRELASSLKLPDPERVQEIADLEARKADEGVINELRGLPFGRDLFILERQILSPKISSGQVKQLIATDDGPAEVAYSHDRLLAWLLALEVLAERQRLAFVEW